MAAPLFFLHTYALLQLAALHPFHISVCEINYNQESESLEITHKLFWDDFQAELTAIHGQNFGSQNWSQDQPEIAEYFKANFGIWIDQEPTKPRFLGFEIENEAVWCYLEIERIKQFNSVRIRNTVLTGLFDDQENIIHFTYQNKIKSLKLDRLLPEGNISFED